MFQGWEYSNFGAKKKISFSPNSLYLEKKGNFILVQRHRAKELGVEYQSWLFVKGFSITPLAATHSLKSCKFLEKWSAIYKELLDRICNKERTLILLNVFLYIRKSEIHQMSLSLRTVTIFLLLSSAWELFMRYLRKI